ncbi:hypothetical protein INT44_005300 [Umbelopsis vinacea]|uniref:Uncharacterized protein n=1 Tax=Umbelopsis vinacea TaxID=44442 RepID=A0A8H7UIX8_9FUNG|nr:hypothetical protein INT44_005300 [Umbelopsis vinacea]
MAGRYANDPDGQFFNGPTSPLDVSFSPSHKRRTSILSTSSSTTFEWPLESFNAFTRRASTSSMSLLGLSSGANANRDDTNKVMNSLSESMRDSVGDASAMYTRVAENSQKKVVQLVNDRRTMKELNTQVQTRRDDIKEAAELIENIQRNDTFGKLLTLINETLQTIDHDNKKSGG